MFKQLIVACLLFTARCCGASKKMPSSFQPISLGTTKSPPSNQCKYEFTVPDKAGFCSGISAGLDTKVDHVKNDLDQTRQQMVKQNSAFNDQLYKLQLDAISHASSVHDVQNELRMIQAAINAIPPAGNTMKLESEMKNARDEFNRAMTDVKDKLHNISYMFHRDSADQNRIHSNILAQINQQNKEIGDAALKIKHLEKQIAATHSNPSVSGGVGKLSRDVLLLQTTVQGVQRDVKYANQLQQQQFKGLEDKTNNLYLNSQNQSSELANLETVSHALYQRLANSEKLVSATNNDLKNLKVKLNPELNNVEKNVNDLIQDVNSVKTQLSGVAGSLMNTRLDETKEKAAIKDLKLTVDLLANQLKGILVAVGNNTFTMLQVTQDLQSLKGSVSSGSPLAAHLQATINQLQQHTSQELQQEDVKLKALQKTVSDISNKLKSLGGKNTSGVTTHPTIGTNAPTRPKSTGYNVPTLPTKKTPAYAVPTLPHHAGK